MVKHTLKTQNLSFGYEQRQILKEINVEIPSNKISVIIGSNGCGKSTLLKSFCKLLKPSEGTVLLDGKEIHSCPPKKLAQMLGLMPQSPIVPEGITVAELVSRGRFPYRRPLKSMGKEDYKAIGEALEMMGIQELADRNVEELSGGQRQRVWIALALAQDTDILFLDEPTTFLDIAYQVEILDLLTELNRRKGTTIVMVLHDINLSARYADHLFALSRGKLAAQGTPEDIVDEKLMREVFGLECMVMEDPVAKSPMVVPKGRMV